MIAIKAATQRSFDFPAQLPQAKSYFSDFAHIAHLLPYVSLVTAFNNQSYRLLYSTTELNAYRVMIFADVEVVYDDKEKSLHVRPVNSRQPIKTRTTLTSLTAQGYYTSRSDFSAAGSKTHIDYHLQLHAELPKPMGLKLLPDSVLNRIADNITNRRMHEIAEGFINQSILDFPKWHAQNNK